MFKIEIYSGRFNRSEAINKKSQKYHAKKTMKKTSRTNDETKF